MILVLIGIFIVAGIIYSIQRRAVTSAGRALRERFLGLGNMIGKSRKEIIEAAGPPTSASALPAGKTLLQWQAPGFHVALVFSGDVCDGISHQFFQG